MRVQWTQVIVDTAHVLLCYIVVCIDRLHLSRTFRITAVEMSFWWNFYHRLHRKLSKWQLPVQPMMKISSKWQYFRFSTGADRYTHSNDVIMSTMASQITSLTIVHSSVYSGPDQIKHQSSASLAFVWGIHRWPVNSPHKWPVTRKIFPFDDVIMPQWHWSHNEA